MKMFLQAVWHNIKSPFLEYPMPKKLERYYESNVLLVTIFCVLGYCTIILPIISFFFGFEKETEV